jgi:hypothetical protein
MKKVWLWNMTVQLLLLGWISTTITVVEGFASRPTRMLSLSMSTPTLDATWPTTKARTTTSPTRSGHEVVVFQAEFHQQEEIENNFNDKINNYNDHADDDHDHDDHFENNNEPSLEFLNENDALLEYSIDSFLQGDYYYYDYDSDRVEGYDEDYDTAVAPLPGLSPGATVEQAFQVLRKASNTTKTTLKDNYNDPSHAAACFLRFCVPLRRRERWSPPPTSNNNINNNSNENRKSNANTSAAWKEILRESLTPTMFIRRLRASPELSILLDWETMDVSDGAITGKEEFALEDTVAFVHAAFYFGTSWDNNGGDENQKRMDSVYSDTLHEGTAPPELLQIQLNRVSGVWLIESIQRIPKRLFQNSVAPNDHDDKKTSPIRNNPPNKVR